MGFFLNNYFLLNNSGSSMKFIICDRNLRHKILVSAFETENKVVTNSLSACVRRNKNPSRTFAMENISITILLSASLRRKTNPLLLLVTDNTSATNLWQCVFTKYYGKQILVSKFVTDSFRHKTHVIKVNLLLQKITHILLHIRDTKRKLNLKEIFSS